MSAYIKRISDGVIIHSCSSQSVSNPEHLTSMQEFLTSRGMSPADYIIADGTEAEIKAMIASAKTPMEVWQQSIAISPMNRNREDHIKDVLLGVADSPAEQAIYDAKVLLRSNKPL